LENADRMSDSGLNTPVLHAWLERMRAGDLSARDELLRKIAGRLERLAKRMLKAFPNVALWTEAGDVLSSAVMRLLRSLETVQPNSVRHFHALAGLAIRRELLDLGRRFAAEYKARFRISTDADDSSAGPGHEPVAEQEDPEHFEKWCRFHEEVEKLPPEEREVVGLIFYQGWKQAEVAQLFQVTERTVRRRWESAMLRLRESLSEQ
jgi:RNA polymerase sigma factor (sigma-70 family)